MPKFFDNSDQEWVIKITVLGLEEVQEKTGIDLAKLADNEFAGLKEIMGDPVKLVKVIHVLTGETMKIRQFAERFDGDNIEAARDAFYEAWVSFCRPQMRAPLTELGQKAKRTGELISEKKAQELGQAINNLDPEAIAMTALLTLPTESAG